VYLSGCKQWYVPTRVYLSGCILGYTHQGVPLREAYIWEVIPYGTPLREAYRVVYTCSHPSGRHIGGVYTLFSPLRETYNGGLYSVLTPGRHVGGLYPLYTLGEAYREG